jgi:hypothetical protein
MGQVYEAVKTRDVFSCYNIKNFVETGTGFADTVQHIVNLNISDLTIHTIEAFKPIYDECVKKIGHISNVNLHCGYSHKVLPDIVKGLSNEPTFFWHDAHFPGADFKYCSYDSEKDPTKRIPLENELRIVVANRDVSKDVFVLDDLRVYEDGDYEGGNWEHRILAGGDGIDFVYELFEDTHTIIKSYVCQGFIILFPNNKNIEMEKLVQGVII